MFMLCVVCKDKKGKMQVKRDKEPIMDEIQSTRKYKKKKIPIGAKFFTPVQTGPGEHPALSIMGAGSWR